MLVDDEVAAWTVLAVDDDLDNLRVPTKILTYHGAQVYTAEDGVEGLEALSKITPTVILLDLSMPNMNGWDMLKEIRADPRTNAIPVIALTAHAMDGDKTRVMAAGFDGYIAKPLRLATFLDEIKRCLREPV